MNATLPLASKEVILHSQPNTLLLKRQLKVKQTTPPLLPSLGPTYVRIDY